MLLRLTYGSLAVRGVVGDGGHAVLMSLHHGRWLWLLPFLQPRWAASGVAVLPVHEIENIAFYFTFV